MKLHRSGRRIIGGSAAVFSYTELLVISPQKGIKMPYDPRHTSDGGNSSTTNKDLKAPKGKFRVIMVDTFDGGDCVEGDYKTKKEAFKVVDEKGGTMNICYVYDSKGKQLRKTGTF